jgi:hypothetical protein
MGDHVETITFAGYAAGVLVFLWLRRRGFWAGFLGGFGAALAANGAIFATQLAVPPLVFLWLMAYMLLFAAYRLSGLLVILPLLHIGLGWLDRRRAAG